jgi:nitroreductase
MDCLEAINTRRSVRQFKDEPVPREVLQKIAAAGIEAPSGCNEQLRYYILVDDPGTMDKLRDASPALRTAPAAVVLVIKPEPTKYGEFWVQDASAAMQNMLLAATALGYGGCWVEGQVRRCEKELAEALDVPAGYRIWSLTPVGRPATEPPRPDKSRFEDVVGINRFGR